MLEACTSESRDVDAVNGEPVAVWPIGTQTRIAIGRRTGGAWAIQTPRFTTAATVADVVAFGDAAGWPVVVKAAAGGYDGRGVAVVGVGIGLALALQRWPGVDRRRHASAAQTAFRFNTYIALALSELY